MQVKYLNLPYKPWQPEAVQKGLEAGRFAIFDTVGVGKTIETIGIAISSIVPDIPNKHIIVCEQATVKQWYDEVEKFCDCKVFAVGGSALKKKRANIYNEFKKHNGNAFLVINYGKVMADFDELNSLPYRFIAFDEAQILSNENKTRLHCKWLSKKRKYVIALTATPITRDIMQMYYIFECIGVEPLSKNDFYNTFPEVTIKEIKIFDRAIFKTIIREVPEITGAKNLDIFKQLYSKFYIRRKKTDISKYIKEVQKNYYYHVFELTDDQKRMYKDAKAGILTLTRDGVSADVELEVLAQYTHLTAILDVPQHIDDTITTIPPKAQGLLDMLDGFDKEQVVIYSRYKKLGHITDKLLKDKKKSVAFLYGDLSDDRKNQIVSDFQKGKIQYLIATDLVKRGLNLQNASNLVLLHTPPTPDIIFQLVGRLDRVGQMSPFINIYFMLMDDTIEYNLFTNLALRQHVFDQVFDEDKSSIFKLKAVDIIKNM